MRKCLISLCIAFVLMVNMHNTVDAAEYNFASMKKFVDSNQWTYVGIATKDSTTSNAELKITKFYDADGNSAPTYNSVNAKATSSGTSTLVIKGSWYNVSIPSSYQAAGSSVALYCKGNKPWLDCKISGYWNVH